MQQKIGKNMHFQMQLKPRRGTKRNKHFNKYITNIFVTYKRSKAYKIGPGLNFGSVYEGSIFATISFSNVCFLFICFTWLLFWYEMGQMGVWISYLILKYDYSIFGIFFLVLLALVPVPCGTEFFLDSIWNG